jgi:hypothetical protein
VIADGGGAATGDDAGVPGTAAGVLHAWDDRDLAHVIEGQADAVDQRITDDALGTIEPEPGSGKEETMTVSRHPEMPGQ